MRKAMLIAMLFAVNASAETRVLVKQGDVIDGRIIEKIGNLIALNDAGQVAFSATGKRPDGQGVYMLDRVVIDGRRQPGLLIAYGDNERMVMNNHGDVVFRGEVVAAGKGQVARGIWLNDRLLLNQKDFPGPSWNPVAPHITDDGKISFAMNGTVYTVESDRLHVEVPDIVDGKKVTVGGFDRNQSGEIVFWSSWKVWDGFTFLFPVIKQTGIFTPSKLLHAEAFPMGGTTGSGLAPRINSKGQIAWFDLAPDKTAKGQAQWAAYVDGKIVPGLRIPFYTGYEGELQFNDRGTLLVRSETYQHPMLVRNGVVTELLTEEMLNDPALWTGLMGRPARQPGRLPLRVSSDCSLNNRDEVACTIHLKEYSVVVLFTEGGR